MTLDQLRAYQGGLLTGATARRARPLAPSTVARATTAIAGFFAFLATEGLIPADPCARLERPRVPEKAPRDVLSLEEVERLLAAPEVTTPLGLRDRAILGDLYGTGLRRSELLDLDLGDVDQAERELVVRAGKGEKGRRVPLGRTARPATSPPTSSAGVRASSGATLTRPWPSSSGPGAGG